MNIHWILLNIYIDQPNLLFHTCALFRVERSNRAEHTNKKRKKKNVEVVEIGFYLFLYCFLVSSIIYVYFCFMILTTNFVLRFCHYVGHMVWTNLQSRYTFATS